MGSSPVAARRRRPWPWLALVAATFVYVWLRLDPGALFETTRRFPAFAPDWHFAERLLPHPGGPLLYLAAWQSQWSFLSWLAAAVLTVLATALCLATARLLAMLSGRRAGWTALLPGTLLLVLFSQSEYHFPDALGVVVAVLGALGYGAARGARAGARGAWFVVLSLVLYALIGGPYLLFVGLCALIEMARGARLQGLVYLLAAEAVPQLVGVMWLHRHAAQAFAENTPLDGEMTIVGRLVLAALWVTLLALVARAHRQAGAPEAAAAPPSRLRLVAITGLLVLPVLLGGPRLPRLMLQAAAALRDERYEDVLRFAGQARSNPPPLRLAHATNMALWRSGRWADDMFHYPQGAEGLMMGMLSGPGLTMDQIRSLRYDFPTAPECCGAFLDLGLVNQAEREASEALEGNGPHARTLRVLARANLVKGRPEAARHYLRALARGPWGRRWARAQLAALHADPTMAGDVEIQRLRAAMLDRDVPAGDIILPAQCRALLLRDKTNRQAFEMLIAWCLLNRDLDGFASVVEEVREAGYTELPRPWQEALVIREGTTRKVVGLPGYAIASSVYQDFARYGDLIRPYEQQGNIAAGQPVVRAEFGNTYFYYYSFGACGEGRR